MLRGNIENEGFYKRRGEIYAIYILKEYQKKGIGRKLLNSTFNKLNSLGMNSTIIWTLEDNPSRYFYGYYI